MPKLWSETIAEHRREVHDAILERTAELVAEHGLRAVTMSQIAQETGIGRATLYKYFPDVEAILVARHQLHVAGHLAQLAALRDDAAGSGEALSAVLEAYALRRHEAARRHGETDVGALVHQSRHLAGPEAQLRGLLTELLSEAAQTGHVRADVAPAELATYCLHALGAAVTLPSKAAVRRLVEVTVRGLQPTG